MSAVRSVVRLRVPRWPTAEQRLTRCADVADLRRMARRRLPRGVFDYIDGGAEAEVTLGRNVDAFSAIELRPRVLRDMGKVDPSTVVLGRPVPLPVVLAPTGFTRIVTPDGELDVARAAARAGLPYTLSTLSTRSIEEVASVSDGPKWFQVYVWRDRGLVADLLSRAAAAHYEAIVITVDTAVLGRRERDVRRGFSLPPKVGIDTLLDGLRHPAWTAGLLRNDPIVFANIAGRSADGRDPVSLSDYVTSQFDPSLSWRDIEWFRQHWNGPILVKGIQTVDDAVIAADVGVDGVVLSNHGGRQLDGAPPPVELVDPVAQAVGDRTEIICDGGVRRGSDIVKAVALGARACMVGRAYLYGLAAAGERGVDHVLGMLDAGVRRTMALCGVARLDEVDRDVVNITPA